MPDKQDKNQEINMIWGLTLPEITKQLHKLAIQYGMKISLEFDPSKDTAYVKLYTNLGWGKGSQSKKIKFNPHTGLDISRLMSEVVTFKTFAAGL